MKGKIRDNVFNVWLVPVSLINKALCVYPHIYAFVSLYHVNIPYMIKLDGISERRYIKAGYGNLYWDNIRERM